MLTHIMLDRFVNNDNGYKIYWILQKKLSIVHIFFTIKSTTWYLLKKSPLHFWTVCYFFVSLQCDFLFCNIVILYVKQWCHWTFRCRILNRKIGVNAYNNFICWHFDVQSRQNFESNNKKFENVDLYKRCMCTIKTV